MFALCEGVEGGPDSEIPLKNMGSKGLDCKEV